MFVNYKQSEKYKVLIINFQFCRTSPCIIFLSQQKVPPPQSISFINFFKNILRDLCNLLQTSIATNQKRRCSDPPLACPFVFLVHFSFTLNINRFLLFLTIGALLKHGKIAVFFINDKNDFYIVLCSISS